MARAAEEVGFDSIWIGDHLLYREPVRGPWEAWTTMAAVAELTDRVRIGPLVACLAFHPPGVVAKMAATLQEVSDGRFVLGVGAGWNQVEFDAFDLPFDHRADRFVAAFDVVRKLVRGERVGDAIVHPPPRPTPLMIGSVGERVLRAALPHVDAWNTWYKWYGNTAEGFATLNERITSLAGGRAIARSACALVVVDRSSRERAITDEAPPIEGTAAQIAARVRELGDAGADEVIVILSPNTERTIRVVGESVL